MKILIDVNLPPRWVDVLAASGFEAVHWASVGDPRAPDAELMRFARERGYVVLTHDLDFGTLLALTRAVGPSVVQIRAQDVMPESASGLVIQALRAHRRDLESGALVTIDAAAARLRVLPIR